MEGGFSKLKMKEREEALMRWRKMVQSVFVY